MQNEQLLMLILVFVLGFIAARMTTNQREGIQVRPRLNVW